MQPAPIRSRSAKSPATTQLSSYNFNFFISSKTPTQTYILSNRGQIKPFIHASTYSMSSHDGITFRNRPYRRLHRSRLQQSPLPALVRVLAPLPPKPNPCCVHSTDISWPLIKQIFRTFFGVHASKCASYLDRLIVKVEAERNALVKCIQWFSRGVHVSIFLQRCRYN